MKKHFSRIQDAPEFVSWRFIQDGDGFGFYDERKVLSWNEEAQCPERGDPSWLEYDERKGYYCYEE